MPMSFRSSLVLASCVAGLALAGCQNSEQAKTDAATDTSAGIDTAATDTADTAATTATAQLAGPDGSKFGTATLTAMDGGLRLEVKAEKLGTGEHGIHLHTTGKCEGPKFESAGSHWNPTSKQHGLENPQGTHSGDMPNLKGAGDGMTTYTYDLKGASLTEGTMAVLDADGTAIVIHAKPDDNKTDPSGNSGDRMICGVFAKG